MVQCRGTGRWGTVVGAWCLSEKTRGGGELSINGHVFLGLGEVTKIEPLRQCLINCRSVWIHQTCMLHKKCIVTYQVTNSDLKKTDCVNMHPASEARAMSE